MGLNSNKSILLNVLHEPLETDLSNHRKHNFGIRLFVTSLLNRDITGCLKVAIAILFVFYFAPLEAQQSDYTYNPSGNLTVMAGTSMAIPSITTQPQSALLYSNNPVSLSVVASGAGISYQWLSNGIPIIGATSDTLFLPNLSSTNGTFSVIVSNSSGSVTSTPAALWLDSRGVGIPDWWQMQYFGNLNQSPFGDYDGDGVDNLDEYLEGTNPTNAASYDPRLYVEAYNGSVQVSPIQPYYTMGQIVTLTAVPSTGFVRWSGGASGTNSSISVVMNTNRTVVATFDATLPSGMVAWWPAQGNALDAAGTNNGTLMGGVNYAPGEVGEAFNFGGVNGYVNVPSSPSLNLTNALTIEAWVELNNLNTVYFIATKGPSGTAGNNYSGNFEFRISGSNIQLLHQTSTGGNLATYQATSAITSGVWHHVAVTLVSGGDVNFYLDGVPAGTFPQQGTFGITNSQPVRIGTRADGYSYFNGLIDELSIYNRALSSTEIASIYNAGSGGKLHDVPFILTQPQSQALVLGSNATVSVAINGAAPLFYQWYFNSAPIPSQTNTAVQLNNVAFTNAGSYYVMVTNVYGFVTSSVAVLSVGIPPGITTQPLNQTNLFNSTASFSVAVSGTGPFNYQWQQNGTNLPNGIITTVAGNGTNGYSGDGGPATNAELYYPFGVAVDSAGNLLIADTQNSCIRKVGTNGIITTVAGNGTNGYSGDGGAATNAELNYPRAVQFDNFGNIFFADENNQRIRKIGTNGIITTVAGNGTNGYSGDGGVATNASLNLPRGCTLDGYGNLFIGDTGNNRVRKVGTNGIISTVAGNGIAAYLGDGGAATNASLNFPYFMTFDPYGNLLIADAHNNCIRKVGTNGIITTVAGNGTNGYAGDGGAATNAELNTPYGLTVDAFDNLYIGDYTNQVIRKLATNGIITTVAGNGTNGYSGDGGAATNAELDFPTGVAADATGNLFIGDEFNQRVRKVVIQGPTLVLNNVGVVNAGSYDVVVSSPFGSVTSSVVNLTVPLVVTTSLLPGGTDYTSYSQTLTAFSGQTPYSWSLISGELPQGLTLATSGLISGTPTEPGTFNFTVQVTDALSSIAMQVLSLSISFVTLGNTNFSAPALASGTFLQYNPSTNSSQPWTFSGQSGVANDLGSSCSTFAVSNPSYTGQYAFIQLASGENGSISQAVTFAAAGTYSISFLAAGRVPCSGSAGNLNYTVTVAPYAGGPSVLSVTNASASSQPFTNITYQFIVPTPGNYVLTFASLSGYGPYSDNTVLITDVLLSNIASLPMFQSEQLANGQFMLTWSAVSNGLYQLQYKTNLSQANWINIGSTITASNAVVSVTNSVNTDSQRFYRVQQQ